LWRGRWRSADGQTSRGPAPCDGLQRSGVRSGSFSEPARPRQRSGVDRRGWVRCGHSSRSSDPRPRRRFMATDTPRTINIQTGTATNSHVGVASPPLVTADRARANDVTRTPYRVAQRTRHGRNAGFPPQENSERSLEIARTAATAFRVPRRRSRAHAPQTDAQRRRGRARPADATNSQRVVQVPLQAQEGSV
jgi:hypothetical protein